MEPDELETWILEEDDDLIVLNKPGWLVCHPSKNGPWSSLVGAVREARNLERIHLVSRLDRETSGLVVLAKHRKSASQLQTAFAQRRTKKRYLALLKGHLEEERRTESNLENDPESPVHVQQRVSFGGRGKSAETQFRPLEYWGENTLVEVIPITGRKHQIRPTVSATDRRLFLAGAMALPLATILAHVDLAHARASKGTTLTPSCVPERDPVRVPRASEAWCAVPLLQC